MGAPFRRLFLLLLLAAIAAASTPSFAESTESKFTTHQVGTRLELSDAADQLRYWIDRYGRIHAPEYQEESESYSSWFRSHFTSAFGGAKRGGLVAFTDPTPPAPRGIDYTTGRFYIPADLSSPGALTRDLLSIPFFEQGARLVGRWNQLHSDCLAKLGAGAALCVRYEPDLASSGFVPSLDQDPNLFEIRLLELEKARNLLQGMQETLLAIPMTADGNDVTYADDAARVSDEVKECWQLHGPGVASFISPTTAQSFCTLDPEAINAPPAWLTEHVDGDRITPQLTFTLQSFNREINVYLTAESLEAEAATEAQP